MFTIDCTSYRELLEPLEARVRRRALIMIYIQFLNVDGVPALHDTVGGSTSRKVCVPIRVETPRGIIYRSAGGCMS